MQQEMLFEMTKWFAGLIDILITVLKKLGRYQLQPSRVDEYFLCLLETIINGGKAPVMHKLEESTPPPFSQEVVQSLVDFMYKTRKEAEDAKKQNINVPVVVAERGAFQLGWARVRFLFLALH